MSALVLSASVVGCTPEPGGSYGPPQSGEEIERNLSSVDSTLVPDSIPPALSPTPTLIPSYTGSPSPPAAPMAASTVTPAVVPHSTIAPTRAPPPSKTLVPATPTPTAAGPQKVIVSEWAFSCGPSIITPFFAQPSVGWAPNISRIVFNAGWRLGTVDLGGSRLVWIVDSNPHAFNAVGFHWDISSIDAKAAYSSCEFPTEYPQYAEHLKNYGDGVGIGGYSYIDRKRYQYEIGMIEVGGGPTKRLTKNRNVDHYPVWSPDGTRIAFLSGSRETASDLYPDFQLYIMGADGSNMQEVVPGLSGLAHVPPVWSPDGKRVAFVVWERFKNPSQYILHTVRTDGSDLHRVGQIDGSPSWSPDGQSLVFARTGSQLPGIFLSRVEGWGVELFLPAREVSSLAWSPDGAELLFVAEDTKLLALRTDGTGLRDLTQPGFRKPISAVSWSPDGSRIAFVGGFQGYSIATMAQDGTDIRVLIAEGDNRKLSAAGGKPPSDFGFP